MHAPRGNLKKKGCCCKHENHRQKGSRVSLRKSRRKHRRKKKQKFSEKNAVGKMQQKAQSAIYRGTAPRKAKRPATPSLKRHAAWEYPKSTAHHKYLFGFRTPTRHVAQPDKKSTSVSKTNYFLTRPFFLRQNRQVKNGGIVGTLPSENTWHASYSDTWHALSSESPSSGSSYKAHMTRLSHPDYLKEYQTTLINITSERLYTIHPNDQHMSSGYNCPDH